MARGNDAQAGGPPRGLAGHRTGPANKRARAANIEDLDDGPTDTKSDPTDWMSLVAGVLVVGAAALIFFCPDEQFTLAIVAAVAVVLSIWYFRPDWRSQLVAGVAVMVLAACARYGLATFGHRFRPTDTRNADTIREQRRGEEHLRQRLEKSGGY
ncbi:MAG: hypothetical protein HY815_25945 [Candidatus Riflebacteria bacterium]|nr:hypothetical protein [Candidatus Riflebacteria bacterium]